MVWRKLIGDYKSVIRAAHLSESAALLQLRSQYETLLSSDRYSDPKRLAKYGFKSYSQNDEDGIISEIFRRIGTSSKTFIEFGAGNGIENNTYYLLFSGWRGLWLEGDQNRVDAAKKRLTQLVSDNRLSIKQFFVTRDNINEYLATNLPSSEIDLLSVDIDGNDYEILRSITCIQPRVIIVEYNAKFRPPLEWVMPYNEKHTWDGSDYYGASLKSFELLLQDRGYSLVGCNLTGVNAFFVRNDLVTDDIFCAPFTAENHYEPTRYALRLALELGYPASLSNSHIK